jgi:sugar phosphate isomerase/epimerase
MQHPPVSLQLFSLRSLTKDDFAAAVAPLASYGFTGVETAGYGNLDATGAAKALAAAGLKCSGQHVSLALMRGDFNKVVCEAHLLGAKNLIVPFHPKEMLATATAAAELGRELNDLGARLRAHGLRLHYHNHAHEARTIDGRLVLDWILDAAAPQNLLCEADVYWLNSEGKSPASFIREQGRRIKLLHFKDEKEIGLGPVNFAPIFEAADAIGALEWQVLEIEKYDHDPLESIRLSIEQFKKWGRA